MTDDRERTMGPTAYDQEREEAWREAFRREDNAGRFEIDLPEEPPHD